MPIHTFMRDVLRYCKQPLFIAGLALRLGLIVAILPNPVGQWYVPFLGSSLAAFNLDPWQAWLSQGGAAIAFPYGYAMWLFYCHLACCANYSPFHWPMVMA